MPEDPVPVPVHIVAGALGVGKTSTLLSAFEHRPPPERWAVLVNEFGRVGIDGARLDDAARGGVAVREIAGGCVCCVGGPLLRAGLVRVLREVAPDRLFVEPSGLAHPAAIVDLLRAPGIREAVELRAVIGLVDPARFGRGPPEARALEADLLAVTDVLVANRTDLADDLGAFRAGAAAHRPPFLRVLETTYGRLPAEVLALRAVPRGFLHVPHDERPAYEHGYVWPPEVVFSAPELVRLLQGFARPGDPRAPAGLLRAKGLAHTDRGWLALSAEPDRVHAEPVGWRRDSRFELLSAAPCDWDGIGAAFSTATRGRATDGGV